jgi:hypothetical protein
LIRWKGGILRPARLRERSRALSGKDRIVHESGRARNRERATESWKRTQREEGGAEEGRAVFEKAARSMCARLP